MVNSSNYVTLSVKLNLISPFIFPSSLSKPWFQMVFHDNSRSPCSVIAQIADSDIFLTIHGFQSIFLLFLPIPSILFEIFPYYYHKDVYQVISNSIGKRMCILCPNIHRSH
jgi:hypothetical protein